MANESKCVLVPTANYTPESREEAVSRGLAITKLQDDVGGVGTTLVRIIGEGSQIIRWRALHGRYAQA